MATITAVAEQFFEACEAGKGWEGCQAFCTSDASFSTQSHRMGNVPTLREYVDRSGTPGLNNKAKLTMRKSYGFRTFHVTKWGWRSASPKSS